MSPCPVAGCGAKRKAGHLLCGECWRRVPKNLQMAVNQRWLAYQRAGIDTTLARRREYLAAADEATKASEAAR